jgi:phosphohistidine phosphatase SixA
MTEMKYSSRCLAAMLAVQIVAVSTAHADESAIKAMAQGGHALLMRHAKISGHAKAMVLDRNGNCANEENLSDEGRAQAQRLKAMLDKAGVKFDAVLTSPFCRAKETAQLAFGRATVDPDLTALQIGTPAQGQSRSQAVTGQLARYAGKGNIALVTHRPNIDALTMELAEEGEVIIAKIQPSGALDVVGRIKP